MFEKVVFDVQLPDRLQKFFPIQFFARRLLAPLSINDVVCAFDQFRFPDGYLIRMDLVLLGDVADGLVALDRLHGDLELEFGGIDRSVLSHGYLPYYCHLHVGGNPPYSTVQFSGVTIPSLLSVCNICPLSPFSCSCIITTILLNHVTLLILRQQHYT